MADPRATTDSPRNEPGPPRLRTPVLPVGQIAPARHACARLAIRVSAIAFCHNPDTSDALFKASVTDFAREGVWA
jgi:hypothetical protein